MNIQGTFVFIILMLSLTVNRSIAQTETFTYTGSMQTYTVPAGVTLIEIETWGAQGQEITIEQYDESTGGQGGYAEGMLTVTPGEVLYVFVGGMGTEDVAGWNGGALGGYGTASDGDAGRAGSGGGASDIRQGGTSIGDRIIVAGGGGGGGRDYVNGWCVPCGTGGNGGNGGGLLGIDGDDPADAIYGTYFNPGSGGGGGTQIIGGLGGDGLEGVDGLNGTLGNGASGIDGDQSVASGGGGGGYYGGGSGAGVIFGSGAAGGGGGGGSSYVGGVDEGLTTPGLRTGNGLVTITVACDPLSVDVSEYELCEGEEVTLDATSDNGGSISWDDGVSNGIAFVPGETGGITYTANSDSDEDCGLSVEIEVFELPEVIAGVDFVEICDGEAVVFSEAGDADAYSWDPAEVLSGDSYFPDAGVITYVLTGTVTATGCENSDDVTVTVHELPTVSAGEDFEICIGDEAVLSGTAVGPGGAYTWDNGVIDGEPFSPVITADYIVIGTDVNGCENEDTVTVIVNALPIIDAGINDTICIGNTVILNGAGLIDPDGYSWSDGVVNGISFEPIVTNLYHVIGTDENGCVNTDSVWVVVNPLPIVFAGDDQAVCIGTEVVLSGSGIDPDGIYLWNEDVLDGIAFTPDITTTYTVIGTDENGCENEDVVEVMVYELPSIDAGEDFAICMGDEALLSASGAGVDGTYSWDGGVLDGLAFFPVSTENYRVIGVDANGCENRDSVVVTVNALPIIYAGEDIEICEGEEVQLNGSGAGADGNYSWNNGVIDSETFIPAASGEFILEGIDINGCQGTDTMTIILNTQPTLNGGDDQRICIDGEIILAVVDKDVNIVYSWDYGVEDGISFIGYSEKTTVYTVTALNGKGCGNTDEVIVDVINCDTVLILPSGFSPNNDGINDYLVFKGISNDSEVYLAVYNDWGMKLFEAFDYQNDWDGTNQLGAAIEKGRELPVGTYYYILKYGENDVVKNYIYIER